MTLSVHLVKSLIDEILKIIAQRVNFWFYYRDLELSARN